MFYIDGSWGTGLCQTKWRHSTRVSVRSWWTSPNFEISWAWHVGYPQHKLTCLEGGSDEGARILRKQIWRIWPQSEEKTPVVQGMSNVLCVRHTWRHKVTTNNQCVRREARNEKQQTRTRDSIVQTAPSMGCSCPDTGLSCGSSVTWKAASTRSSHHFQWSQILRVLCVSEIEIGNEGERPCGSAHLLGWGGATPRETLLSTWLCSFYLAGRLARH